MDQSAEWLICNYCKKNFHGKDKLLFHKKNKHLAEIRARRASLHKRKVKTAPESVTKNDNRSMEILRMIPSPGPSRIQTISTTVTPIPRKRLKLLDSSSDSSSSDDELEYSKLRQDVFVSKSQKKTVQLNLSPSSVSPRVCTVLPAPSQSKIVSQPSVAKHVDSTNATPSHSNHTPSYPLLVQPTTKTNPVIAISKSLEPGNKMLPARKTNGNLPSTVSDTTSYLPINNVLATAIRETASKLMNEVNKSQLQHSMRRSRTPTEEVGECHLQTLSKMNQRIESQATKLQSTNSRTQEFGNSFFHRLSSSNHVDPLHLEKLNRLPIGEESLPASQSNYSHRVHEHGTIPSKSLHQQVPPITNQSQQSAIQSNVSDNNNNTPVAELEPIIRKHFNAYMSMQLQRTNNSHGQQQQCGPTSSSKHVHQQSFSVPSVNNSNNSILRNIAPPERQYPCSVCYRKFDSVKGLKCHSRVHKPKPLGLLPITTKQNRAAQQVPHENIVICPEASTSSKRNVEAVIQNHTKTIQPTVPLSTTTTRSSSTSKTSEAIPKNYQCALCQLYFVTMPGMERHMKQHNNVTLKVAYGCSICKARFETEAERNEHLKVHTTSLSASNSANNIPANSIDDDEVQLIELSPNPVETENTDVLLASNGQQQQEEVKWANRLKDNNKGISSDQSSTTTFEIIPIVTISEDVTYETTYNSSTQSDSGKAKGSTLVKQFEIPLMEEKAQSLQIVVETQNLPVVEETQNLPVVEETQNQPLAEETQNQPLAEETQHLPVVEETQNLPLVEETQSAEITETVKCVAVVEKEAARKGEDAIDSDTDNEPKEQLLCYICAKMFHNVRELYTHIFEDHTENEKNFPCTSCLKTFESADALENHKQLYHIKICEDCKKSFTTTFDLTIHRRQEHNVRKIFACSTCRMGFHVETALIMHRKITDHKP